MRAFTRSILILSVLGTPSYAQITVPPGFAVDQLSPQISGQIPRLEAVNDPSGFGFGVLAATAENGIVSVLKISPQNIEVIGTIAGLHPTASVGDIQFDDTGLFDSSIILSIWTNPATSTHYTQIFMMDSDGASLSILGPTGGSNARLFMFDISDGSGGYEAGLHLYDVTRPNSEYWLLDPNLDVCVIDGHTVPPGRVDIDVRGMEFDRSGVCSSSLLIADSDANHDNKTIIYELFGSCASGFATWTPFSGSVNTQTRFYRDLTIASGGAFGTDPDHGPVYVADTRLEAILSVDCDGIHSGFATGFTSIRSVSASPEGGSLFVSDSTGVYRIRPTSSSPGPILIMRAPMVLGDDSHSGRSGVDSERLLFSEPVDFVSADVEVVNEMGETVAVSAVGSGTPFVLINFGETLWNDTYTITVHDSVIGTTTGEPIDGDGNGIAGGDLVIVMKHEPCAARKVQPRW